MKYTACPVCGGKRKPKRTPYGKIKHDKSFWCNGCDCYMVQEINKKSERQTIRKIILDWLKYMG